jgi:site-specific DNA recombinase
LPGEQAAIVDRQLFDAVQVKLTQQVNNHKTSRMRSEALLAGRIFDDRGNRMTPSHVRKRGIKYRYYLSATLLQGQAQRSGSIGRVPASDIEALVTRSVREHLQPSDPIDDRSLIADYVERVEIQQERLIIQLAQIEKSTRRRAQGASTLYVAWHKTPATRRREMLLPASLPPQQARSIRSESRATLIASIARGRRWLNELIDDAKTNVESIARRERCSVRQVNMTISLAFLAPVLVKAAIEGCLPRGIGVTRLRDAPVEWSRQQAMLGLIG